MINTSKNCLKILIFTVIFTLISFTKSNADNFSSLDNRIIGGTNAATGAFPWATALYYPGYSSIFDGQFCGGALIGENWVVTAAHCVVSTSPSSIRVAIGRENIQSGSNGQLRNLNQIIIHPSYNSGSGENDIALIELSSPSSQTPLELISNDIMTNVTTGVLTKVIGWGATYYSTGTGSINPSPTLQQVDVPIYSQSTCQSVYGNITNNKICAGVPSVGGKDSCQGDSGGPLMYNYAGTYYLTGIVSSGAGCALADYPGIYTRVSQYLSWIESETGITPGGSSCDSGGTGSDYTPTIPSGDSDLDGVSDANESTYGTSLSDQGSFPILLNGFGASFWNGFLDIINVLELINTDSVTSTVTVKLYTIEGNGCNKVTLTIPPGEQRDVILNEFNGFIENSYGLITVEYSGGKIDGRTSYYRASSNPSEYDFAYSIPLYRAFFGTTNVAFNTYQPSQNPSEASNLVPNWLSIVNLSDSYQNYTIYTYDIVGNLINTRTVGVSPKARQDLEAGHIIPGPSNVGLHKIVPASSNKAYMAFITRYGNNVPDGQTPTAYNFATRLVAQAGNGEETIIPVTTTIGALNWLELINTSSFSTFVNIAIYRYDGALMANLDRTLAPRAQEHININTIIGNEKVGFAKITPANQNSIISQSMVYTFNSLGGISNVYTTQGRENISSNIKGSYNLFLGMFNWVKLINPENSNANVTLTIKNDAGTTLSSFNINIPANSSLDVGPHDYATFNTNPDTVGQVQINSTKKLLTEILRIKATPSNTLDYIFTTQAR